MIWYLSIKVCTMMMLRQGSGHVTVMHIVFIFHSIAVLHIIASIHSNLPRRDYHIPRSVASETACLMSAFDLAMPPIQFACSWTQLERHNIPFVGLCKDHLVPRVMCHNRPHFQTQTNWCRYLSMEGMIAVSAASDLLVRCVDDFRAWLEVALGRRKDHQKETSWLRKHSHPALLA